MASAMTSKVIKRSDQKITDQLIMLLLYLTSLPFGVDNVEKLSVKHYKMIFLCL
jgi:hypothetical protein